MRIGTVHIAEDLLAGARARFEGDWDREPDGAPAMLEEMPAADHVEAAIAWGRTRADRVIVRLGAGHHFWAGARTPASWEHVHQWPPTAAQLDAIAGERDAVRAPGPVVELAPPPPPSGDLGGWTAYGSHAAP